MKKMRILFSVLTLIAFQAHATIDAVDFMHHHSRHSEWEVHHPRLWLGWVVHHETAGPLIRLTATTMCCAAA